MLPCWLYAQVVFSLVSTLGFKSLVESLSYHVWNNIQNRLQTVMWIRFLHFQHSSCLGSWQFDALNADLRGLLHKAKAHSISPAMCLYGLPTALCIFIQTFQGSFNAARTGRLLGMIKTKQIFLERPETSHYLKHVSMSRSMSVQHIFLHCFDFRNQRGNAEVKILPSPRYRWGWELWWLRAPSCLMALRHKLKPVLDWWF